MSQFHFTHLALYPSCVNAAVLAMVDAGIEMMSLVSACEVALIRPPPPQPPTSPQPNPQMKPSLILDPTATISASAVGLVSVACVWDVNNWIATHNNIKSKLSSTSSSSSSASAGSEDEEEERILDVLKENITSFEISGHVSFDLTEDVSHSPPFYYSYYSSLPLS